MRKTGLFLLIAAVIATLFTAPTAAADTTVTVTGRFIDMQGQPVAGITLTDSYGNSTTSGANGTFSMNHVYYMETSITISWTDNDPWYDGSKEAPITAATANFGDITLYPYETTVALKGRFVDTKNRGIAHLTLWTPDGETIETNAKGGFTIVDPHAYVDENGNVGDMWLGGYDNTANSRYPAGKSRSPAPPQTRAPSNSFG